MEAAGAHRIFGIEEMREAILFELPTEDLLLSQRVCKSWKSTIDSSVKLQKALFFIPETPKETFSPPQPAFEISIYPGPVSILATAEEPVQRSNPFLKAILEGILYDKLTLEHQKRAVVPQDRPDHESSWRRMLLTQPPMRTPWLSMSMYMRDGNCYTKTASCRLLESNDGFTIDNLLKVLVEVCQSKNSREARTGAVVRTIKFVDLWYEDFVEWPTIR